MKRILIIDDDKISRTIVKKTLEREGYLTDEASNGRIGAAAYRKNPYDLIITDIFMPEQDGITTIRELRREFPRIKIIAMSGGGFQLGSAAYLDHAKDFGALHAFTKPLNLKELATVVQSVFIDEL